MDREALFMFMMREKDTHTHRDTVVHNTSGLGVNGSSPLRERDRERVDFPVGGGISS